MKYKQYLAWEEETSENKIWILYIYVTVGEFVFSHHFSPFCIHLLPSRHLSLVQRLNFCPLASFITFPIFIFSLLPFFILFLLSPVSVHLTASALVCCCLPSPFCVHRWKISIAVISAISLYQGNRSIRHSPLRLRRAKHRRRKLRSDENKESYFQQKRSLILLTMPKQNRKGETEAAAQSPALFPPVAQEMMLVSRWGQRMFPHGIIHEHIKKKKKHKNMCSS